MTVIPAVETSLTKTPNEPAYNEIGIAPIVFRISPGCLMPLPSPADIPPGPEVRGYLLPGDKGYVPYRTVPEEELRQSGDLVLRT